MASDQFREQWSAFSNRNAVPLTLLCLAAFYASGCAYTGSVRDYVHNGFKVGPEYQKPAAAVEQDWIDSYDKRLLQELPRDPSLILTIYEDKKPWSPDFGVKPLTPEVIASTEPRIEQGAELVHKKGCLYCHDISGQGGHRGPELTLIGSRLTRDDLIIRINNDGYNMPAFATSMDADELDLIVDFLLTRRDPSPVISTDPTPTTNAP